MADYHQPYVTIRTRHANDGSSMSSADSAYGSGNGGLNTPSATHDTSRVNYHVKHLDSFAKTLEESAGRAFPNTGKSSQRYNKVQALLLHWKSDDLFVLPELEDLQKCLRDDYSFDTDIFSIPSDNAHLELMMRVGSLVKEHEAHDTLFIVYYGGHARIDESRQSTWCATRQPRSPSLQWSAIQTLLERSVSDVLVLLDCCAGAASATFPSGKSITETISASSWDAIAPDPGRYSFTNALIEVLQEWRIRTFSAAMLHAEVLARLKHPRPITINGKHFEARSTPVHFMMTSNHKAPSIELTKLVPADARPPSPPQEPWEGEEDVAEGAGRGPGTEPVSGPNEDEPHVMISLALEDNQELDLNAWEQWLAAFPALAKHVKVQGVFKSHSTLLLLSMPVMIWDLLPEDHACSFVAFIRSNNLIKTSQSSREEAEEEVTDEAEYDSQSIISGTTYTPADERGRLDSIYRRGSTATTISQRTSRSLTPATMTADLRDQLQNYTLRQTRRQHGYAGMDIPPDRPLDLLNRQMTTPAASVGVPYIASRRDVEQPSPRSRLNQTGAIYDGGSSSQISRPRLSSQVVDRLEEYFQEEHHHPTVPVMEFFSSTLGVRLSDIDAWFHNRRQQQLMNDNLQNLRPSDHGPEAKEGAKMILPGHLNTLLEIFPPSQVLLVDLRSPTDFEKSHVHGAVNLRIPLSFVRDAASDLDLVEMAFTDEQSRRCFSRWKSAKCIVFYDRVVEFPWECPVADAMYEQFKRESWEGQCYILKGHYREFSASFDKYISGNKMTQGAKDYVDGLRERATPSQDESRQNQERYSEWVHLLENEDRVPSTELIPSKKAERMRAVEQHQSELQTEFEGRFPALVTKARSLRPAAAAAAVAPAKRSSVAAEAAAWLESRKRTTTSSSNSAAAAPQRASAKGKDKYGDDGDDFGAKAQYVEPLAKGLQKMQKEGRGRGGGGGGNDGDVHDSPPSPRTPAPPYSYQATTYDKLSGEAAAGADDFDDIDPKDEQLRNDPAFQKAGDLGDAHRRAVKDGRFWKLLQRNK